MTARDTIETLRKWLEFVLLLDAGNVKAQEPRSNHR